MRLVRRLRPFLLTIATTLTAGAPRAAAEPADGGGSEGTSESLILTDPTSFDCSHVDYGLYWYGAGNRAQKAVPGRRNAFYDPARPTVIYVHGWKLGRGMGGRRDSFTFVAPDTGQPVDTAKVWVEAGWNVGAFYWTGMADELSPWAAEDKIWDESAALRWRQCDGSYSTVAAPAGTITELFAHEVGAALADYRGPQVRLVGHSLGSQIVTRAVPLLREQALQGTMPAAAVPQRVALVDPFWTSGLPTGRWRGAEVRAIVAEEMAHGVLWEMYKTSDIDLLVGDMNLPLIEMIGGAVLAPTFIKTLNPIEYFEKTHSLGWQLYFLSLASPPPTLCHEPADCNDVGLSAATSDERVRELMAAHEVYRQVAGGDTATTADDIFAPFWGP